MDVEPFDKLPAFSGFDAERRSTRTLDGGEAEVVRPLNVTVALIGVVIAGVGVVGVLAPSLLLELGRSLLSSNGLYAVAGIRVAFGVLLVLVAPHSRAPQTLRVIGAVIILNGLVTPFFGVERSEALLDWFSMRGSSFVRAMALFAIAFGAFVVYAVNPRRHSAV